MAGVKRLILILLLFPSIVFANTKLPEKASNEIIAFTLFNYDNLIADSYESEKSYIKQLSFILNKTTNVSESRYYQALDSEDIRTKSSPVKYLISLNKITKNMSGYYFIDD